MSAWQWIREQLGHILRRAAEEAEYEEATVYRPYPNEHACRLRDPDEFQEGSFRRISQEADGKRLDIIIGRPKGKDTTAAQAFRYPKDEWSAAEARAHCEAHEGEFEAAADTGERSLAVSNIWGMIMSQMAGLGLMPRDIYAEGDELFLIAVADTGRTVRIPVILEGDEAHLGTPVEVVEKFEPLPMRGRFSVFRAADGRMRWVAIAGASVLNRCGEIDSTMLYDSFVENWRQRLQDNPKLDFYHTDWVFGTADWLARCDNLLLASGTFDEAHPLTPALIEALQTGRGRWGCSVAFEPLAPAIPTDIGGGVTALVYTAGVLRRIAILPEREAASWFTRMEVNAMDEKLRAALVELFGDEAKAEEFVKTVDQTNQRIRERGLIVRSVDEAETDLQALVAKVAELGERTAALRAEIEALVAKAVEGVKADAEGVLGEVRGQVAEVSGNLNGLAERLAAVEAKLREQAEREADMPAAKPQVTWRPRQARGNVGEAPLSEVAQNTLAQIRAKSGGVK